LASLFKTAVDAIKGEDGNPLLKIVHNGLRHSYISYRVADIKIHLANMQAECIFT